MPVHRSLIALTLANTAGLIVMLAGQRTVGAQGASPAVLRGRGLEIVDDHGRVRASITVLPAGTSAAGDRHAETVLLRLITERGRPSVKIAASEEAAGLSFAGPTGTKDTYVILEAKGTASSLKLRNENGQEQVLLAVPTSSPAAGTAALEDFLGTWRGSSTCVDREIAAACKDETVVYDVRRSDKPDTATVKADKIVDGKRLTMGEFDFTYAADAGCWRTELSTPRFHGVWCLAVDGKAMTGSLRDVPTGKDVRRVQLKRDP